MRLDPLRERAILDATSELLSEVGYDRMSVDQIARRASASKATIYRRWPGKEALVVDLVCNHLQVDAPAPPDTGTMRGDLIEAVTGFCRTLEQKHSLIFGLFPALLNSPELAAALRDHVPRADITGTTPLLDRARERGELSGRVDPAEIKKITEATVWYRLFFTGDPLDRTFVEETVDRILLPLIRAWSAAGT
ncbi:AcrR family transcriptional regulator [Streptosporangium becharense]|uniref:AcrR family transcriptional regulator n=1 Tax=Streptosporangium becharense TaxID=1816182 RepID=A0A7W9IM51_9ACTN|nr:TetR/AcrR family transcriptional regulator [Streptosporangium becharense]MBB2910147.1 AcrR family transcriptional regulator [Streptosporangium becharense]MBB5822890.1 AcrR family transcriptional regulator [Streptosporangium becharense]